MKLILKKYFFFFLVFVSFYINCQEFKPIVSQFTKNNYNPSNQNWAGNQSADGTIYFGNNQGLLQFDGTLWKTYKIPETKIARSILIKGNRIFVGSFEEFGYLKRTIPDNSPTPRSPPNC